MSDDKYKVRQDVETLLRFAVAVEQGRLQLAEVHVEDMQPLRRLEGSCSPFGMGPRGELHTGGRDGYVFITLVQPCLNLVPRS